MTRVTIDPATGALRAAGKKVFPIGLSNPPPPIGPGHQNHRQISVENGRFADWFAPHDAHVYRFAL